MKASARNWRPGRDRLTTIDGAQAYVVDISSDAFPETFTIVDPDVYESTVYGKKWTVTRGRLGGLYVRRNIDGKSARLHRLITGATPGLHVDHINGDSLDNRRINLRVCLPRENAGNSKSSSGASRFKGVSRSRSLLSPWKAQICVRRRSIHLGCFASEEAAAAAYNAAAIEHFGEFALLNVIPDSPALAPYTGEASASRCEG